MLSSTANNVLLIAAGAFLGVINVLAASLAKVGETGRIKAAVVGGSAVGLTTTALAMVQAQLRLSFAISLFTTSILVFGYYRCYRFYYMRLRDPTKTSRIASNVQAHAVPSDKSIRHHSPEPSGQVMHAPVYGEQTQRRPRIADALQRYRAISIGLALTDAACILAALILSYELGYSVRPMPARELAVVVVAPFLWVAVFRAFHLYAPQHLSPPDEFRRLIGATTLGISLLALGSSWFKSSIPGSWLVLTWLLALPLELIIRRAWERYQSRLKLDGRLALRTLIVGTTTEASQLGRILAPPGSGYIPLGYVQASDPALPTDPNPVVGDIGDLRKLIHELGVDCLFVASTSVSADDMFQVTQVARREGVKLEVSANLAPTLTSRLTLRKVRGVLTLSVNPVRLTRTQVAMKRTFDVLVSAAGLVLLAPMFLMIALAIKLTSPGPVLFRQQRVGLQRRPFTLLKFRTMVADAEVMLADLLARNEADGPLFKLHHDPRVTRIGRVLRHYSLDELPQLWNVLKGEMSLVGPRPPLPSEVAAYEDWQLDRLEVRPGITGLWQVSGRSEMSFEGYVRLDPFYVENWSLAYDLFILLKTFGAVLGHYGRAEQWQMVERWPEGQRWPVPPSPPPASARHEETWSPNVREATPSTGGSSAPKPGQQRAK
jgi:exopolysaccharide biosynthesis polyprenyl glycosylphosphotransferase